MKSFQQLAQVAYEAIATEIERIDSTKAKPWPKLSPIEQAAWVVAMQAVVAELEGIH